MRNPVPHERRDTLEDVLIEIGVAGIFRDYTQYAH